VCHSGPRNPHLSFSFCCCCFNDVAAYHWQFACADAEPAVRKDPVAIAAATATALVPRVADKRNIASNLI